MRLALNAGNQDNSSSLEELSYWASLPGVCCQAAGGLPEWADQLTLAWLQFFTAAHLMDSVQDGDEPDPWWADQGAGVALSTASGLFFSASLALHTLHENDYSRAAASEITRKFYSTFLIMCSGQYADLTIPLPTLEQYWQQAATKSGAFFSMACWGGARLAIKDEIILDAYAKFGCHLGLLVQIKDDLDEVSISRQTAVPGQKLQFKRSLPVVYALEVLPPEQSVLFQEYLRNAPSDPDAANNAIETLDAAGAAEYIRIEIERHKRLAWEALEIAQTNPSERDILAKYIDRM